MGEPRALCSNLRSLARNTLVSRECARVLHRPKAISGTAVPSRRPTSEYLHWVKRVTWGERMEWSKKQKRRAEHMPPREESFAEDALNLSAVHGTSRDGGKVR